MKISKLFHWLYASVMFIPLMILPILGLAVRSDNNFQPIEVQAQDYDAIDFNQIVDTSKNNYSVVNTTYNDVSLTFDNDNKLYSISGTASATYDRGIVTSLNFTFGHKYYFKTDSTLTFYLYGNGVFSYFRNETIASPSNSGLASIYYYQSANSSVNKSFYLEIFDLTQMFGAGNEPTIEQFNSYFPNDYYEYTISKKVLLNVGTTTYNDTDVGSQMVYTLYNATDKYFNFNQFLGIGNLFDWFQLNVFNGSAPLGFIIFWNLLIYWLLVSIAWLIFDIAMFVPKLAHRWLDKASLE